VLVIACPCALGGHHLDHVASGKGAENGLRSAVLKAIETPAKAADHRSRQDRHADPRQPGGDGFSSGSVAGGVEARALLGDDAASQNSALNTPWLRRSSATVRGELMRPRTPAVQRLRSDRWFEAFRNGGGQESADRHSALGFEELAAR